MLLFSRRSFTFAAAASAGAAVVASPGLAQNAVALRGDDGHPVVNFRLASELSPATLPGITWVGSEKPDVTLIEFFDYNCTWCRRAEPDLDALLQGDSGFRLGLVNYAVFGIGSIQAAKVQQAVLKLAGPQRAYAFHKAMFTRRGHNDGDTALATAITLGLDRAKVADAANGDDVTDVLKRQAKLAEAIGFNATPSFAMNGVGLSGYPGPRSLSAMIGSVRKCDKLSCA